MFLLSPEVLSLLAIVVWALFLMVMERFYPYDPQQKLLRKGWFTDFFWYTLVQSYAMGVLIKWLIEAIDSTTGLSRLHIISAWPVWAQFLLLFVVHDLYIYSFHRLQHRNRFLWRIHEAHHSVEDVDWLAGSRSHAIEILINQTVEFAPVVLLGAHPVVAVLKGTVDAVWGMYIHANLDVKTRWLQYVVNGPEMHRWHHSKHVADTNFSTKIALWDWLFGSAYLPPRKPAGYGLMGDQHFPGNYFAQQLHAFRPMHDDAEPSAPSPSRAGPVEN